ncbi:MAG: ACP S-malonyltransferase [Treponema sp.]|jgi:[acyl-carrier-protein] S-malonyltransferase|nr:ACP S-malonyltransferase [Treponema sp.]
MVTKDTKTAFLFPGQGAQYQGMALDLLEAPFPEAAGVKELFALASDIMGRDMRALLAESDGEALKRTDISQPAITTANLAAAAFLAGRGIVPSAAAGFSLGEYAALAVSGILSTEDCLTLVRERGKAMQEASDRIGAGDAAPGMAAVIGLAPEQVEELIARWKAEGLEALYGANFNSPKQVVVSGTAQALACAETRFKEAGARRVIRLPVAGPFHSPLMAQAAAAFAPALEAARFNDPAIPFYSNVSGAPVGTGAEARQLALRQITEPVRWTAEEGALAAQGNVEALLETGPGKALQSFWKDSGGVIPVYPAGTLKDIEELAVR